MNKFSSVFFDLDGTLTNPELGITTCAQLALKHFGIDEKRENLRKLIGPPLFDSFKDYGLSDEQVNEALQIYRQRFSTVGLFENVVYDGIPEVLKRIKEKNATVLLATSKPEIFAVRILEKFNIAQYFDEIVGSELNGDRVEKDEVIREGLRRLNVKSEDSVIVGDRKYDILGAKKAGLQSIGVRYGFADNAIHELENAGADLIVNTVCELGNILETYII